MIVLRDEAGKLPQPTELHGIRLAVSVFGNDTFADIFIRCIRIIVLVFIQKENDIRVLFNGAGIAQVRKTRPFFALIGSA